MEGYAKRRVLVLHLGSQLRVISHERLDALPELLNRCLEFLVLRFLVFKLRIKLGKFFVFKRNLRLEVGNLLLKLHIIRFLICQLVFKGKKLHSQRLRILNLTALRHHLKFLRRSQKLRLARLIVLRGRRGKRFALLGRSVSTTFAFLRIAAPLG